MIKCVKPLVKTVNLWLPVADFSLFTLPSHRLEHDCFQGNSDINIYIHSVLDHINKCVVTITTCKRIKTFPNQKPWLNKEIHHLLKAGDTTFRSGYQEANSSSSANLRRGIIDFKYK